jgi:homogentisate 1,2-dioxygenase
LIFKYDGGIYASTLNHSPLNVVAWHGNYVPYKYDLRKFNTINTVSYDHPDPSIFTVLTSPTNLPGTANIDFVIFPPRWMVAEKTFRPPYFHRNVMSEYMGLIYGVYDAKPSGGFVPGGCSLHNMMTSHGPETTAFQAATVELLKPTYQENTMAFMFESSLLYRPTPFALNSPARQKNYQDCWNGFKPATLPRR